MLLDPDHGTQWSVLDQLHFVRCSQVRMLRFEVHIDVPGIPLLGSVDESLEQVAADHVLGTAGVRFRCGERFLVGALIEKACHTACLQIDLHSYEVIFQSIPGCFQGRTNFGSLGCDWAVDEICLVSECRCVGEKQEMHAMSLSID